MIEGESQRLLRRLALDDERLLASVLSADVGVHVPDLDDKAHALVRLAAVIATESSAASYQRAVAFALSAGATEDEMTGVLVSIASLVGAVRVTSAAPVLAAALGYDVDTIWET